MSHVRETYLGIFCAVLLLVAVSADGVIVETGIFDESDPLAPPRRNVAAIVLIEVLAKESCRRETGGRGLFSARWQLTNQRVSHL